MSRSLFVEVVSPGIVRCNRKQSLSATVPVNAVMMIAFVLTSRVSNPPTSHANAFLSIATT